MVLSKKELIPIFRATEKESAQFGGKYSQSTLYDDDEAPTFEQIQETNPIPLENHVVVEVLNSDTLDAALTLVYQGLNPLVLNMASDKVPGGGSSLVHEHRRRSCFDVLITVTVPTVNYTL